MSFASINKGFTSLCEGLCLIWKSYTPLYPTFSPLLGVMQQLSDVSLADVTRNSNYDLLT